MNNRQYPRKSAVVNPPSTTMPTPPEPANVPPANIAPVVNSPVADSPVVNFPVAETPVVNSPVPESAVPPVEKAPVPKPKPPRGQSEKSGSKVVSDFSARDIPFLLRKAEQDAGAGKYDDAQREYRIVLQIDPNNASAKQGLHRLELSR
jgi:hypothetical protein